MTDDRVSRLVEEARRLRWSRRKVLKRAAALGLSAPAISMVLAACGGDDPAATTAPAPAPATTPTAGAATTPAPAETPDVEEPTATTAAPVGGGGIINIPTTLGDSGIGNPILTSNIQMIEYYVFNRLMIYNDEGTLVPELAADWTFSDDNLTLTITLNEATWHDGEAFTADDVIFTFDTIAAETTETGKRSNLRVAGEFVTWAKVDDYTITITSPEAFAPLLFQLNQIPIIPEHLLSGSADINTDEFNRSPIGTGSYMLEEWASDQFMRFVPYENHFRGRARNDGLTVFFYADTEVSSAALDAGTIDMMFTPPELQPRYEGNPNFKLYNYVYFTPITLSFNHKHPILQDITVRRAIGMAIDKVALTESVTRGRGTIANNQFANSGPLDRYNDYDNVEPIPFDVAGANAMLDEAGYAAGSDGIRVAPDGTRFEFDVITYSGFEEYQNGQVIIQEMLREIGMEVTPQVVEYTTLEGMWADPNDPPENRALELEEWPHPFEFDPDLFNELHSDSLPPGLNYMWFEDDEVDRLIEVGRTTTDPDERVAVYKELDVRRSETLPTLPLYNAVDGWVASTALQGVADTPYYRRYVLTSAQDWSK
ncbi:MAG TPA: ABC transporter substrate-binding protein [Thermomicrobiales bacterium]|nr:ABC transporter substrate-binding protein [Thermomicrobiales bacterium]